MRDEYIAKLDRVRDLVGNLDGHMYHLEWLSPSDAEKAIRHPAEAFGYTYDDQTVEAIRQQLGPRGSIQPAQLQIVCDKLWERKGRELAAAATADDTGPSIPYDRKPQEMSWTVLRDLGGVQGILESFFKEFLKTSFSGTEREEVLEMLQPLVTVTGTRNIVSRDGLVRSPLRNPSLRAALLERLEKHGRIVRIEHRLGGEFVEITHEFLIPSVLQAIEQEVLHNPNFRLLGPAITRLSQLKSRNYRVGTEHLLAAPELTVLKQNFERLLWEPWATEVALRSCVVRGAALDNPSVAKADIKFWVATLDSTESELLDAGMILDSVVDWKLGDRTLSWAELRRLTEMGAQGLRLNASQARCAFLSSLLESDQRELDAVRTWTSLFAEGMWA